MASLIDNALQQLFKDSCKTKKLWTNASPTSTFAEQSIKAIGLSGHDMYEIVFEFHITNTLTNTQTAKVGKGMLLNQNDSRAIYRRNVTVSGDILSFTTVDGINVANSSIISDNKYLVPIEIYGIKILGGALRKVKKALCALLFRKEVLA